MSLRTEWVRYGAQLGYLAYPERAAEPLPAVVVVQEVWGVDAHIQDVTRRIAAAGYAALAPDLFSIAGERPPALRCERLLEVQAFLDSLPPEVSADPAARDQVLAKLPADEGARIRESRAAAFGGVSRLAEYVPRLLAASRYLRQEAQASRGQKVACVGFCMGGGLSALLACHDPELAGAAVFYGSSPPAELIPRIACPVIGFYGGLDARITAGVGPLGDAMKAAGKRFEPNTYEGAPHAFFNDTRRSYRVGAARDSFAKLLEFLRRTLIA